MVPFLFTSMLIFFYKSVNPFLYNQNILSILHIFISLLECITPLNGLKFTFIIHYIADIVQFCFYISLAVCIK